MKQKKLIFLVFILFSFLSFSQEKNININNNFIICIDDEIVPSGIYGSYFLISDSLKINSDTLFFHYKVGRLLFEEKSLKKIKWNNIFTVSIVFEYLESCPVIWRYKYIKAIPPNLLFQEYAILKIYNFSKKTNYKHFTQKKDFGLEIFCPQYSLLLPRKRKNKSQCK